MGWYRASHFSHVSASPPGGSRSAATTAMRSSNGGWHGLAGWGFRGLSETGAGLRADDGGNFVSDAGSPLFAANLCLAKLRSVPEFSGAEGFSFLLATQARRTAVFRHRGAFQADQTGRIAHCRRRVSAALKLSSEGDGFRLSPPDERQIMLILLHHGEGRRRWPSRSRPRGQRPAPPRRKNRPRARAPRNPQREKNFGPSDPLQPPPNALACGSASPSAITATRISTRMVCG